MDYYYVVMQCLNCGYEWTQKYRKGVKVPMYEVCPWCECTTAQKV